MVEPLTVDTARLTAAGVAMRAVEFPVALPAFIATTGADAVSAAVSKTMSVIESPVIAGLPAVEKAVKATASSMVAAAGIYADADQALSEHVAQVAFLAAPATSPAPRLMTATGASDLAQAAQQQPVSATPDKADKADKADKVVTPVTDIASPGQLAGMVQALQPASQGLQTIMSSVQQAAGGTGGAGSTPAQLTADQAENERSADDELVTQTMALGAPTSHPPQGPAHAPAEASAPARPTAAAPSATGL